jgi:hypothetical protein
MSFPLPDFNGNIVVNGNNMTNLGADFFGNPFAFVDDAALYAAGGFNNNGFLDDEEVVDLPEEANDYHPQVGQLGGLVPSSHYPPYKGLFGSGDEARAFRKRTRMEASDARKQAADLERVKRNGRKFHIINQVTHN